MKPVKRLFDMVKVSYDCVFGLSECLGTGWTQTLTENATCLIAVAWVLESMGHKVSYYHNDYLPFFSMDQVYYDLKTPNGTTEVDQLKHGGNIGYRASELFIIYDIYLNDNVAAVDFINAFSINNKGAKFPYGSSEV